MVRRALDAGLVINSPAPGMLRLPPPLVIEREEVDRAVGLLRDALA